MTKYLENKNKILEKVRVHICILSLIIALLPIESAISGTISPVSLLVLCYLILSCLDAFISNRVIGHCVGYVMLFFAYCALSLLWGLQVWRRYFITSFLQIALLTFFSITDRYNNRELNFIKKGAVISSAVAILAAFISRIISDENRLTVSILNPVDPNEYAMGICFCVAFLLSEIVNGKHKILTAIGIVGCSIIIFMTGSRGGMLTLFVVFAIWFILFAKKYRIKTIAICGVAALIFYIVFMNQISDYMIQRFNVFESLKSDSGAGRFNIWSAAFDTFNKSNLLQKLFGNGYGLFAPTVNYVAPGHSEPYMAHNMWVDCLITGGILGCILLFSLFIQILRIALKGANIWGVLAIISYLISSFSIDAQLYKIFAIVIFIAFAFRKNQLSKSVKTVQQNKRKIQAAFCIQEKKVL